MENKIAIQNGREVSVTHLSADELRMKEYLESHACTETTRRARREDWKHFQSWAHREELTTSFPLSWQVVEKYLLSLLSHYSLSTAERRIATLSGMHTRAQAEGVKIENPCTHPAIRQHLKNAKRAKASKNHVRKKAITFDVLSLMLATCDDSLQGTRDRALLLFAFASGGRRRSEVAAAQVEHLESVTDGYRYFMPRSKTDQEGEGQVVPVLGIASEALRTWLNASGITEGSIFRGIDRHGNISNEEMNSRTFARTVERRLKKAGLNISHYSAHSIRSGFVTEAANRGHNEAAIMSLTGHKSTAMVKRYYRAGDVLNNPAARICG